MGAADRPFSEVLKSIFNNVEDMIRGEIKLVKTEAREEVSKATRGAAWFAVAMVSGLFALAFILLAVFFALLPFVPGWAAAAIIAGSLALVSAVTVQIGAKKRSVPNTLRASNTKQLHQEENSWAKHQAR